MTKFKSPVDSNTRIYEPIWRQLKVSPFKVRMEVHPSLVPRIKKAVSKEKYNDLGFKELHGHRDVDTYYLKFTYDITNQILTVELLNKYGVDMLDEVTHR